MDEPRESDIMDEPQLDLVNLSSIEESSQLGHHSSKGFCVKEYDEQLERLRKENFNLKHRLYFITQNSTMQNSPTEVENFQKQFTDIKVRNFFTAKVNSLIIFQFVYLPFFLMFR